MGIHHGFGPLGPFGQRPNKGLGPLKWGCLKSLSVCASVYSIPQLAPAWSDFQTPIDGPQSPMSGPQILWADPLTQVHLQEHQNIRLFFYGTRF